MDNGQGKLTVYLYRYQVDLLIAFKAIPCFVTSHAKLMSLLLLQYETCDVNPGYLNLEMFGLNGQTFITFHDILMHG